MKKRILITLLAMVGGLGLPPHVLAEIGNEVFVPRRAAQQVQQHVFLKYSALSTEISEQGGENFDVLMDILFLENVGGELLAQIKDDFYQTRGSALQFSNLLVQHFVLNRNFDEAVSERAAKAPPPAPEPVEYFQAVPVEVEPAQQRSASEQNSFQQRSEPTAPVLPRPTPRPTSSARMML